MLRLLRFSEIWHVRVGIAIAQNAPDSTQAVAYHVWNESEGRLHTVRSFFPCLPPTPFTISLMFSIFGPGYVYLYQRCRFLCGFFLYFRCCFVSPCLVRVFSFVHRRLLPSILRVDDFTRVCVRLTYLFSVLVSSLFALLPFQPRACSCP